MSVEAAIVESLDYGLSPLPVRAGLVAAQKRAWARLGQPGRVVVRRCPHRHRRGNPRGRGLRLLPRTQGGAFALRRDRRA